MPIPSIETKTGNWSSRTEVHSLTGAAGCCVEEQELNDASSESIQLLIAMNGRFLLPNR